MVMNSRLNRHRFGATGFILLLLLTSLSASAQELRTYNITCNPGEFAYILENPMEDIYIDCTLEYNDVVFTDARIRLRGETSREYPKKSFKVNFDADRRFYGRDKMNLVSEWMDRSFAREFLAYDFFRRAGLPASHTWYIRLYVNGDYLGLYLDIEQIDEHYLRQTDLADDASIYKADENGTLLETSDNVEDAWDKETNEADGYGDLYELIYWLNGVSVTDYYDELESRFDRVQLARVIALNALIGNQSTYYHNYYMIHDVSGDGRWQWLPWDMDATFYFWSGSTEPPYFRSGHQLDNKTNPLVRKSWLNADMRNLIYDQMRDISEQLIDETYCWNLISNLRDLIYDAVDEDPLKQFTTEEFVEDINSLAQRISDRRDALLNQVDSAPYPFQLGRAIRSGNSVYFTWTASASPLGEPVVYQLLLGDSRAFDGETMSVNDLSTSGCRIDNLPDNMRYWRVYAAAESGVAVQSIAYFSEYNPAAAGVSGTVVDGAVTSSTSWGAEQSPYWLPLGLIVEPNAVLAVQPGTVIRLGPGQTLYVYGGLTITGQPSDSVVIEPFSSEELWGSIYAEGAGHPIRIQYASVSGGGMAERATMIKSVMSDLTITDSRLYPPCLGSSGLIAVDSDLLMERVAMSRADLDLVAVFGGSTVIRSCRFADNAGRETGSDLVDIDGSSGTVIVEKNTFRNPADDAVDFDNVIGGIIAQNVIEGARDKGMSIGSCREIKIENNIVTGCETAVLVKGPSSVSVYNNVLAFCEKGIWQAEIEPGFDIVIRNTIFFDNEADLYLEEGGYVDLQYCAFSSEPVPDGAGNIGGDLKLGDPYADDFYSNHDSPLIDAGYGPGSPQHDIRDSSRYDITDVPNTGWGSPDYVDIGAYEFIWGSDPTPEIPETFFFLKNYPNPFNTMTRIRFGVVLPGPVELVIYDRLGRRVTGWRWSGLNEGNHYYDWYAITSGNDRVASGLYFCRLSQRVGTKTVKMILLR